MGEQDKHNKNVVALNSLDHLRLIPLGVIGSPHGVRGQVKIRSFTSNPQNLTAYGALCDKSGKIYDITILSHTHDAFIASIAGITTREAAQSLRNIELCVPRGALPQPKKGEYYHEDLTGIYLITRDGNAYGTLTNIHNFGAGDLAAIKRISGEEEFILFSPQTFLDIDIEKRLAIIDPPENI